MLDYINNRFNNADIHSKELIFNGALTFFNSKSNGIDKKDFKYAKEVLVNIENWELRYGNKKYSVLKNNSILVGYLAYRFGELIGLSRKELSDIYVASLVKDVGKMYMCDGDMERSYEYFSSPLTPKDPGFEDISEALKKYPKETEVFLNEKGYFSSDIVNTAVGFHSVYSKLFKEGYPDTDRSISQLDTVLWFADSLSAISFSSIKGLERSYSKDKYISLIEGLEILRAQTGDRVPKFWDQASGTALMGVVLTMVISMSYPSKSSAAEFSSDEVVTLVNEYRRQQGLPILNVNEELVLAAMEKAKDMLEKGYWSHYGPNGETPWQFILSNGYEYSIAGENLAKGFRDADRMMNAWLDSPTHRENIVKREYEDIGVAVIDGNLGGKEVTLVVQIFGKNSEKKKDINIENVNNSIEESKEEIVNIFTNILNRVSLLLSKRTKA